MNAESIGNISNIQKIEYSKLKKKPEGETPSEPILETVDDDAKVAQILLWMVKDINFNIRATERHFVGDKNLFLLLKD